MSKLNFSDDGPLSLAEALGLAPTEPQPGPGCDGERPDDMDFEWKKVRVRFEFRRKGTGGHPVTLIRGVPGGRSADVLRELKSVLGVGGGITAEGVLYVTGDQKERLQVFFVKKGAKDVG